MPDKNLVSKAYQTFLKEAPGHSQAWIDMIHKISRTGALDEKTAALCYLSVLAALRLESGVAFHVQQAKKCGASREEVISAILLGLPPAGLGVIQALPPAIEAYDGQSASGDS
ncbi:MAG: carboxymuconolactone decarboxylase family protein [Phycisphaerae bacterium]|nr:carboxymuconolactone decarboxylase family protein [Phycisphaerae bacterium]